MSDNKTYIYSEPTNGGTGFDNNLLTGMLLGGGGMMGMGGMNAMWNNPIWALVFLSAFNNGGFGWGNGNNCNANTDFVASQLGQAIAGNANAINNLATHLDCSIGQVQSALTALQQSICSVGNQVGMSSMQVINAIQAGNSGLASQLAQCCCDIRNAITTQGYETRIATQEQSNFLGAKIDYQTTFLADKFCELEKREMQNKIDALREEKSTLQAQLSNEHQTIALQNFTAQTIAPVNAALAGLKSEVDGIKCKLPQTLTVPYSPATVIPNCVAYDLGFYGGFAGGRGNDFL